MTQLSESALTFDFDDSWRVVKWDDHPAYRNGIGKLQVRGSGLKAVDFIARRQGSTTLVLIEVKNYSSAAAPGPTVADLAQALKVKLCDSLVGVFGVDDPDLRAVLGNDQLKRICYVVWVEDTRRTGTVNADVVARRLRKELIKLTSVRVLPATTTMNAGHIHLDGVTVS